MANHTTRLTRRIFSNVLAIGGLLSMTPGRAFALEESDHLGTGSSPTLAAGKQATQPRERWKVAQNEAWQWYERESMQDGHWVVSGITTPIHRPTGKPIEDVAGYLDESLVPADVRRRSMVPGHLSLDQHSQGPPHPTDTYGRVSPERRAREGRPPSNWLRSMDSEELREWLSTVDVGEAGVRGMTFWTHLTRDHLFKPLLIKGLTETEQAKLHAAAHFGY